MQYRKLAGTDIEVSAVAMGCWAIVGDATWGKQDAGDTRAAIHACLDCGVTLFDTAEMYGNGYSEEVLGRELAGHRDEVVLATKATSNHCSPAALRLACENSLRRLRTDTIDLYQVHWPSRETPFPETADTLAALQREGKIRSCGVSNFGPVDLHEWLSTGSAATNQVAYNLLFRAVEWELLDRCREAGVGLLCYAPLQQGLLTGKFADADAVPAGRARTRHFGAFREGTRHGEAGFEQETFAAVAQVAKIAARLKEPMARVAMAWLLARPAVTAVVAGARNGAQVRDNAAAADLQLAPESLVALDAATEPLKHAFGPNLDMWESPDASRIR